MTRELIGLILELIVMLFLVGFSFAGAAVVCAVLVRISGFDSSSGTFSLRHLKLWSVSSFSLLMVVLVLMLLFVDGDVSIDAVGVVGHHFCLLSTDLLPKAAELLFKLVSVRPQLICRCHWQSTSWLLSCCQCSLMLDVLPVHQSWFCPGMCWRV